VHYPLIFGVYNGERIEPDKDLDRNGVNYCTDEKRDKGYYFLERSGSIQYYAV